MSDAAFPQLDRRTELLADRALFGLDEAEQRELSALLDGDDNADVESFDRVAASAQLATLTITDELPTELAGRLLSQGQEYVATGNTSHAVQRDNTTTNLPRRELVAWLAAAASILFALFSLSGPSQSPLQLRSELLALASADSGQLTQVAWTVPDGAGIEAESGDVVWHNGRQEGVMKFTGLPANDPTVEQYQLWIFDAEQDERYPVDGGVFDVPAGSNEVHVKIDAKLPVVDPTLFAITIEKPGGVVVSSRERLPLLAAVE